MCVISCTVRMHNAILRNYVLLLLHRKCSTVYSKNEFFFLLLLLWQTKNIFGTFDLLFILLLFISTLLTSSTILSLLSQHPNLYSFYLNAYLGSLEPQTFGFPLDSCPDALPLSHADLDASSTIFKITYTL